MRFTSLGLVVVALTVAACGDQATGGRLITAPGHRPSLPILGVSEGVHISSNTPVSELERVSARTLAQTLARALKSDDARLFLKTALASSANREGKLHFASFLAGRGAQLLGSMPDDRQVSTSAIETAIARTRDLELYMPVRAHRASWTERDIPDVAIALREEDPPEVVAADGTRRLLNRVFPPSHPVLVLAPVETDFRFQRMLSNEGRAERNCVQEPTVTLATALTHCAQAAALTTRDGKDADVAKPSLTTIPEEVEGLYATQISFFGDECGHECWAWGDPEYEIHVLSRYSSTSNQLIDVSCAGEHQPSPASYDQNGRSWAGRVRLLTRDQMNQILAIDNGWQVQFWEDDQDACVTKRDNSGILVFASGVLNFGIGAATSGGVNTILGVTLMATSFGSLGGADDFIGDGIEESQTIYSDGNASPYNTVILRDNGVLKGRATLRFYTGAGPYTGPTASVDISNPSGTKMPVGYTMSYQAFGYDAFDTPTNTNASWSSSNTSVATVNAGGIVSGVSAGTTTITATIDGVSASSTLQVLTLGAPYQVALNNTWLAMTAGQSDYLVAHTRDSNGFELPVSDQYTWRSSNPSVCSVGADGTVTANAQGWADISADADGLVGYAACSVSDGGGGWNRTPAAVPTLRAPPPAGDRANRPRSAVTRQLSVHR